MKLPAAILPLAFATLATPAFAVQDAASAAARGQVNFNSDVFNQDISAKEKPMMIAKGKAVGETIISTPALKNPVGMAINWHVRVSYQQEGCPRPIRSRSAATPCSAPSTSTKNPRRSPTRKAATPATAKARR